MLDGIFIGYVQHAGGGWTGDLWVIDKEEISTAEYLSDVTHKRFTNVEVDIIKDGEEFKFPMIEEELDQPGGRPPFVRRKRKTPALEYIPVEEQQEILDENSDPFCD